VPRCSPATARPTTAASRHPPWPITDACSAPYSPSSTAGTAP
jgi:hypothetical protein